MPAFSFYETASDDPACFVPNAEIIISLPGGVESRVPVRVVREPPSERAQLSTNAYRIRYEVVNGENRYTLDPESLNDFLSHVELLEKQKEMDKTGGTEVFPPDSSNDAQPATQPGGEERCIPMKGSVISADQVQNTLQDESERNYKVLNYLTELDKQNKYLKERNMYRFHIIPDGNCLYRAVCKAVYGDQSRHVELREYTVHHIADHLEEFGPIIEGDIGEFIIDAAQDGAWAGYPELLAMSQMLGVSIHLTTGGSLGSPTVSTMVHYLGEDDASKPSIWLSWLSSGHYDVVFDRCLANPEYDSWCRQIQAQRKRDEEMANSIATSLSKMYIDS
ncbi:OTU domain-containing protein 1-like [Brienomyrus brachyistius]|uniref:OTU domain-containing protein 1-like n=1 Tax=Brienomyrus brachyistius TaxID=42636 RepID=UPI0020B26442|nr:OTU domain-containing protein 1-like [Brienomyrus brachyistius]